MAVCACVAAFGFGLVEGVFRRTEGGRIARVRSFLHHFYHGGSTRATKGHGEECQAIRRGAAGRDAAALKGKPAGAPFMRGSAGSVVGWLALRQNDSGGHGRMRRRASIARGAFGRHLRGGTATLRGAPWFSAFSVMKMMAEWANARVPPCMCRKNNARRA
jgi:hypothetical protein